jgi:hypothetical protein
VEPGKSELKHKIGFAISKTMHSRFLVVFRVVFLSAILIYSGVAWTMENCMRHHDHSGTQLKKLHNDPELSPEGSHSQEDSTPIIHCAPAVDEIGPALYTFAGQTSRLSEGLLIRQSVFSGAITPFLENSLWLETVFRNPTFFTSKHPSLNLLLAVLRI